MKKFVLLMVVFAMCVPSYGSVRVFNLKVTVKPAVVFTSGTELTGDVFKGALQGYAVIDENPSNGAVGQTVNNVPTAVIFGTFNGQKVQQTFGGGDANSSVAITRVNGNVANSVRPFVTSDPKIAYTWLNCEVIDTVSGFDLSIFDAFGKIALADVGTGTKSLVVKSMKGAAIFEAAVTTPIEGSGIATLSFNAKYTIMANTGSLTVAATVAQIQADLVKKKFVAGDLVAAMLDF
jgi:hypothetical protein